MPHAHVKDALPRLRRHAFILAGDRALADESVAECLKAYRRDPQRVRPEAADIDLFRLFHDTAALGITLGRTGSPHARAMASVAAVTPMPPPRQALPAVGADLAEAPGAEAPDSGPEARGRAAGVLGRFQALPAAQRQVLTLVSVEGFSVKECAHVLDLPAQRVGTLLAEARNRLAGLPAYAHQD